jgi:transcriptional regulator GlxA family with amidase domain
MRLNQAGKLLIETDRSIADIAYNCGFNNLSNFNRQFRTKFLKSPKTHRNAYSKIINGKV